MARFDVTGLDDVIKSVARLGEEGKAVGDEMLLEAAEEVKQAWKQSATMHQLKDTGDMIASINYPRTPKTAGDVRSIDIYPQGKNRKGVRTAEVAFIQHYGSSKIPATHWVDDADEAAGPRVKEAMERVFNNFINRRTE